MTHSPVSPVLDIQGLHLEIETRRSALPVLRDVSLTLAPGEVHGLVGESGAGKTMVARAVLGILPRRARISAGTIRFQGNDLLALGEDARRRLLGRSIAMIPQDPTTALNPSRRIGTQLADYLRLRLGVPRSAVRGRSLEMLAQVHLREPERLLRLYPHELSGGMRQRVLIAAAFAAKPALIIADEPTTALDVTVQRQILRLIRELQSTANAAILFVTHDLGVVSKICDRVSVIYAGRIIEQRAAEEMFDRPAHAYTKALMRATPRYDRPGENLAPVPASLTAQLLDEALAHDRSRTNA